ncbi:MAG: Ribbon-helix-helix protein, copG family [Candidatus Methanolliviera sp. GoM_oil]|nr:MAG: Ribbon-helix-helix protein, copG family [Candidatus Methanolliviera sp. GoM_oil]
MHRVTISLPDEILERVDRKAKKENLSRSACISELITFGITGDKSDEEVNHLKVENENLKRQVSNLEDQATWLRGECSKLSDAMIQKALPRKSVFSKLKFWGKR